MNNKFLIALAAFISFNANAEDGCDYSMELDTSFKGTINSTKILKQESFPYVDGTKKCVIRLSAEIKNKWYTSSASYIYEPDMSESDACKRAEYKAKETILHKYSPEMLNRKVKRNCKISIGNKTSSVKKSPVSPKIPPYKCMISVNWIPINIGNKSVRGYKEICNR
jgi:hypothetical protein